MKLEILFIIVIGFFIYDAYKKHQYTKTIKRIFYSYQKYSKTGFLIFTIFCTYLLLKKNPEKGQNLLFYANNMVKSLPIDKSLNTLSPIIDFTQGKGGSMLEQMNSYSLGGEMGGTQAKPVATKRSVSETKKKFVASQQGWKCQECKDPLNAWFEVDHKIRLEYGGSNAVDNLVALCRECHGRKTAMENM